MSLESVVRPFETPQVTVGAPYVAGGQKSADPILVQIGRGGQGKTFQGHTSAKVTYYTDAAEVETH